MKVVYDAAYEHMVSKPAAVFRELVPMILSGLPAIENLAVFLDEHRNVIEYRGGVPVSNNPAVRSKLAVLLQATVEASEISAEGKRKLRAMAEGK